MGNASSCCRKNIVFGRISKAGVTRQAVHLALLRQAQAGVLASLIQLQPLYGLAGDAVEEIIHRTF